MKTAIYPGSFNPWHDGHNDILRKSLQVFDHVTVLLCNNPEKKQRDSYSYEVKYDIKKAAEFWKYDLDKITVSDWNCLLVESIDHFKPKATAIIRGLRNGHDLQYEMNQQYLNEDLGLKIPIVYFVTDRNFSHVSSSAIRAINEFK